ncbi:MAG: VOC family protein [Erysipelotrichaceae bacterium]
MKEIQTCLWFDTQALEAAEFYVSLFASSELGEIQTYRGDGGAIANKANGSVMSVSFRLFGMPFFALNGGPEFQFSLATSFIIPCDNQEEADRYWYALKEGGITMPCGWVSDRFGITWQVVPNIVTVWMQDPDEAKVRRMIAAFQAMERVDIEVLRLVFEGE